MHRKVGIGPVTPGVVLIVTIDGLARGSLLPIVSAARRMHLTRHLPRSALAILRVTVSTWLSATLVHAAQPTEAIRATAAVDLIDDAGDAIKDDVRAVVLTPDGTLIAGSNRLAAFDGDRWQAIATPTTYGFRALAIDPHAAHRVWVGAIDQIGFIDRSPGGDWAYTPISTHALQPLQPLGDIWSVHTVHDPSTGSDSTPRSGAVWIADQQALRWDGAQLEAWPLPSPARLGGFSAGAETLIYQTGRGLLRLGLHGEPALAIAEADLPVKPVTWLLPQTGSTDHASGMIVGLGDAAYLWDGASMWTRLEALSQVLAGKVATHAVALDETRIAIATFDAGIVLATRAGEPLATLGTAEGLPDESVYTLAGSRQHLFAATAGGLARVDGAGDTWVFRRDAHLEHGIPRKVFSHAGTTYVLTSKNLSRAEPATTPVLQRLTRNGSPLHDATAAAGELWLGGVGGIWRAGDAETVQELHAAEDVLQLTASARVPGGIVFTEGYRVRSLAPSPHGGWAAHPLRVSLPDTPVSLLEDAQGFLWASTIKGGIGRYRWSATASGSLALELADFHRPGAGLPADTTRPVLTMIGGQLHAFSEERPLRLAPDGRFRVVPGFERFAVIAGVGIKATNPGASESPTASYWLVQPRELAVFGTYAMLRVPADPARALEPIDVPGLDHLGALTRIDRTMENGAATLWIGGARGLLRVAEHALRVAPATPRTRIISSPVAGLGSRLDAVAGPTLRFPAAETVSGEAISYQTRLEGAESAWNAPTRVARREFSRLAPGDYVFHVRPLDRFARPGPTTSTAFVVAAPWWRRPAAYAAYGVLLALVIAAAARWRIRRLQRQNERLNRLVAERTRELELSNHAKSEFLENISHEIRNPLNGLGGLLNLMHEEKMAPPERELARSLKTVAATLTRVFEDVLEFSKLEYGYARLHPAPFSLRFALEEIITLFGVTARQQNCTLTLAWTPDLADGFLGDAPRIKTIVTNFVGNALKYAPGAPVEIRVSASDENNGLVDLYVEVVDRGPGIPPEEQGLIFKKFVRGSDAKRREIAGTGLGLATCHVLARLMNGSVGVESTPGQGATFFLRLLLPRAELPRVGETSAPGAAQPTERALVVDDEGYNRTALAGLALELGFATDVAASGVEALRQIHEHDYAVVFMDWELPGLKGGDIAKFIRARAGGDRPIILATTAHDSDEMQDRCRSTGMDGFLRKPFDAEQIRRAIATIRDARARAVRPNATVATAKSPAQLQSASVPLQPPRRALDLRAFDHYARARPEDPAAARRNYLATLAGEASDLVRAVEHREIRVVAEIAHRLRALAGLIGAAELNVNARRLEELARGKEWQPVWHQAQSVLEACAMLRERLEPDPADERVSA